MLRKSFYLFSGKTEYLPYHDESYAADNNQARNNKVYYNIAPELYKVIREEAEAGVIERRDRVEDTEQKGILEGIIDKGSGASI